MGDLTRGDEYRCIAREMVELGQPDLAKQAWALSRQIDREEAASAFMQAVARAPADVGSANLTRDA